MESSPRRVLLPMHPGGTFALGAHFMKSSNFRRIQLSMISEHASSWKLFLLSFDLQKLSAASTSFSVEETFELIICLEPLRMNAPRSIQRLKVVSDQKSANNQHRFLCTCCLPQDSAFATRFRVQNKDIVFSLFSW